MGLLDTLSSDDVLSGLLSAGAASGAKGNFLSRMAQGAMAGEKFAQGRREEARQRSQDERDAEWRKLQTLKAQMEMRQAEAAMAKKDELSSMIKGLFGGGGDTGMSPGAYSPSFDGMGPTMPAPKQGFSNATIDQIAALKAAGGPDLVEAHKYANDPLKLEQGATYKNRNTGAERFMPKLDPGIVPDGNGGFTVAPGYASANANIRGAETSAVEGAKAGYDFVDVPQSDGTSVKMPRNQALQALSSGTGPNGSGGLDLSRVSQEQAARLLALDPQAFAAGVARFGAGKPGSPKAPALGVTQSPADAVIAKGAAEAEVARNASNEKDAKLAGRLSSAVDRALQLLDRGPTESGLGTAVDKTASFFGGSTNGAQIADKLRTLSGWMVANVPRMEGPQSNFDVANYQTMAGIVGDSTIPVPRRKAAAMEVKRLQEKYAALNQGTDKPAARTIEKTGTYGGRKVVQYSDGSTEYAD